MANQELNLAATTRTTFGNNANGRLRRQGLVPGVIYGVKEPLSIQVDRKEATRLVHRLHGTTQLVKLVVDKKDERHALLKEVQSTAVGQHLLHLDFNEVDFAKKVRVSVEVKPVGNAIGLTFGGTLQQVIHELHVECLPKDIPHHVEVDVTKMNIGHSLHVKDLPIPESVHVMHEPGATVVVMTGRLPDEEEGAAKAESEPAKAAE